MKKRVFSMLMVMIMMVSMLSVSVFAAEACETHSWIDDGVEAVCKVCGENHVHSLSWVNTDAENHWAVCTDCPVDAAKQYNNGAHEWTVNDDTATADVEYVCTCGAVKAVHEHKWSATLVNTDATNHYYVCELGCGETKDVAAHTWEKQDTSTDTDIAYACSACGATKGEHVCVWETEPSWNGNVHWYDCVSLCGAYTGEEEHYDHTSDGACDICGAGVAVETLTSLTITGLSEPAEGAAVDFTVNVAESRYGTPVVKWNRVTDLSKNASVALGSGSTFAGGNLYNASIIVPINSLDDVSHTINITLNGQNVPYYTTDAAFNSAVAAYQGNYTAYMAKCGLANDYFYIMVCAMYPTTAGEHTHSFGSEWIETSAKHYLLCSGCGETKDTENHYDNNKSGLCDVCGFDMKYYNANATASSGNGGTTAHTHAFSGDWVEDISNHWKQCSGCGAKTELAAHADANNTGKCDVCGFVMTPAAGHTHSFAAEWTETFAQHYKVCSCGAKNEIAAHVDLNNTGKCDTCGYAMTTLSNNGIVADTGDDNATFLWLAAFAVSVLGAGATIVVARKKREE